MPFLSALWSKAPFQMTKIKTIDLSPPNLCADDEVRGEPAQSCVRHTAASSLCFSIIYMSVCFFISLFLVLFAYVSVCLWIALIDIDCENN